MLAEPLALIDLRQEAPALPPLSRTSGSRLQHCAPPQPDAPAPGRREAIAPTLPDAIYGASTPVMPPTRKLPHYCWDFFALSPEQRYEAEHKPPRDVDQPSKFVTIVDHECPHAEPGAAQTQPYLMDTRAGHQRPCHPHR
jgi:hypothetical protein